MLNSIIKDFALWLYSLFVELLGYAAKSLLGLMNTDLAYFESNVPVVTELYRIFVAIGWGLLIGNCIFQCLKAMFAGLGFETESPPILLVRTFLFGFLLFFSHQICEIALSIGQKITELIGIPEDVEITFPDKTFFTELSNSWLLIIIVGVLIGIQVLKLFFEIGERYAVVAVLTLFSPLAFAMGGSRSTKDICSGFIRTYASMILLLISNVLFLKLILSAMGAMPTGLMVLPWTVLIVGLAKTARKADNLLSKIGMNPTFTGDPLDHGTGRFIAMLAARSVINSAMHTSGAKAHNSSSAQNSSRSGFSSGGTRNSTNGSNNTRNNNNSSNGSQSSQTENAQSSGTVNSGGVNTSSHNTFNSTGKNNIPKTAEFDSNSGGTKINTNRFGTNPPPKSGGSSPKPQGGKTVDNEKPTGKNSNAPKPKNERGRNNKGSAGVGGKQTPGRNKNNTFGAVARQGTVRHNPNPERFGKNASPPVPEAKDIPNEAVKDNEQDRK